MAKETTLRRIALGLCIRCGGPRTGENCVAQTCGICVEKRRDTVRKRRDADPEAWRVQRKAYYDARKAAGICNQCGKKRTGQGNTAVFCRVCAKKRLVRALDRQQRERNRKWGYTEGDGRTAKKYPIGRASTAKREGGAWYFVLPLDRPSYDAIQVIRKRYRDAEYKAGREPLTHQNSRLVREIILRYEPSRAGVNPRKHRLITDWKLHLSLDGRTRAIVERHAAKTFNGNISATIRAMLIQSQGFRRAFTGRGY